MVAVFVPLRLDLLEGFSACSPCCCLANDAEVSSVPRIHSSSGYKIKLVIFFFNFIWLYFTRSITFHFTTAVLHYKLINYSSIRNLTFGRVYLIHLAFQRCNPGLLLPFLSELFFNLFLAICTVQPGIQVCSATCRKCRHTGGDEEELGVL